jgi:hypothetical protein
MKEKVNLSAVYISKVFYDYIYPVYAKEFLFACASHPENPKRKDNEYQEGFSNSLIIHYWA